MNNASPLPRIRIGVAIAVALTACLALPATANTMPRVHELPRPAPVEPPQSIEVPKVATPLTVTYDGYEAESAAQSASYAAGTTSMNRRISWPFAPDSLTDVWGPRSCEGCSPMHHGLDFAPGDRTPIPAAADGFVREVVNGDPGLGTYVVLEHTVDGRSVLTRYAHMTHGSAQVEIGQLVRERDILGLVGNTGASTGPHLHFEVFEGGQRVDPYEWLVNNSF